MEDRIRQLEERVNKLENPTSLSDDMIRLLINSGFMKTDTLLETWRGFNAMRRTLTSVGRVMGRNVMLQLNDFFGQWTNGGSNQLLSRGSNLANGLQIILSTTGELPTGLSFGSIYYVRDATPDTFRVALSSGGTAVTFSGQGIGVHYWEIA